MKTFLKFLFVGFGLAFLSRLVAFPTVGGDVNLWGTGLFNFFQQTHDMTTGDLLDKALGRSTINTQSGTTYTPLNADAGKTIRTTSSSPNTITFPSDANMSGGPVATGTEITICQGGTGLTAIAAGAGAIVRARGLTQPFHMSGQYAYATAIRVAADTWEITGDVAA